MPVSMEDGFEVAYYKRVVVVRKRKTIDGRHLTFQYSFKKDAPIQNEELIAKCKWQIQRDIYRKERELEEGDYVAALPDENGQWQD